jgi:ABC-2 type transport system ATP-binding protein
MRDEIGADILTISTPSPDELARDIAAAFGGSPSVIDGTVRVERTNGHEFIPQLVTKFPGRITAVTYAKPTLEDVFIHKTGRRFWSGTEAA